MLVKSTVILMGIDLVSSVLLLYVFPLYICFFSGKDFLGLPMSVHSI